MMSLFGVPLIDGGQYSASLVYVDNLVEGIILAATRDIAYGEAYHFRDDWSVTWKEYITDLGSLIGKQPRGNISFNWHGGWVMLSKPCSILSFPLSADQTHRRRARQGQ